MEQEAGWLKSDFLSEDESRRLSAHGLGIPFVILKRDDISIEALNLIPEPLSRARNIVAYRRGDGEVEIALLDIADLGAIDFLKIKIKPRLTNRDSIKRALLIYQQHLKEKFAGLAKQGIEAADSLLRHALHSNAAHVHLEPAAAAMLVRYRIGGVLHEAMRLPKEVGAYISGRIKTLAKLFPVDTTAQEGRFKIEHDGRATAVHVSTVPTIAGEKIFLRFAHEAKGQKGFTLQSLGFHGEGLERIHALLHARKGLVVVSGPQKSGITTTLYTLLDELNNLGIAIATIEERVEHVLPQVAQMQTRNDVGLGLLAGLRAVLRQDPDVVMVSNIGERDVAELAARSAKRGIFVLAGMEAKSPARVIDTLKPHASRAILNQRLVRKLCVGCREAYCPSRQEFDTLEAGANFGRVLSALKEEEVVEKDIAWKELDFFRVKNKEKDCGKCREGYQGRLGVQEIVEEGVEGLTLVEDGLFKAAQGLTSIEEVVYLAQ